MRSKQELSETRKEQILQAATAVFARLGFYKARMDDVVQEAGLSKGAVYWYFESKDEIITTILDRFMQQELENFTRLSQGEGPIPKRLRTLMTALGKEMTSISDLIPIAYEYYAVAAREETTRKKFDQYLSGYVDILEELISEGIERGELKEVPTREVAISLVALMEGCMLLWVLRTSDRRKPDLEKLYETSIDLVLEGLIVEG
jgi:AcrR family transcriptional regulator